MSAAGGTRRTAVPEMVRVSAGAALRGEVRVPGDKSISHRALILGALAEGTSVLRGLSDGDDVGRTAYAVEAMGAEVHADGDVTTVTGGRGVLHAPAAPIDCGNSGTTMRLLAGFAAGLEGETVLMGDDSLSQRPMDRVAVPLSAMGASVSGVGERCLPPITVKGGSLRGAVYTPPVASAQVKSAVLLAGLFADGDTVVHEPVRTRAHTEELLARAGADVTVDEHGADGPSGGSGGGRTVRVRASPLAPLDLDVPGDPSQAAFWVVAACLAPGSAVRVRGVYAEPERAGFIGVLQRMGAAVTLEGPVESADVVARFSGRLHAASVDATEIPSLDEVPVLAVAAACAEGETRFSGMGELRVKETDRLAAVADLVRSMGAAARVEGDDLFVRGTSAPLALRLHSRGDHRMAMAGVVAGLAASSGESRIDGFDAVSTSYRGFLDTLRVLGGAARLRLVAIDGPAGSGKSTVSAALSARLGLERLDTGAMYRAVAWAALERGLDPADAAGVAAIARGARIEPGASAVRIDGADVTDAIRTPEVNVAVSAVAANPAVRATLVERQRAWADRHWGGVVEGRDIGTVVFPEADLKVFLTATPGERARRRGDEAASGLARRDLVDSTRAASPLAMAADARLLDTTGRSVDDVVDEILSWLP